MLPKPIIPPLIIDNLEQGDGTLFNEDDGKSLYPLRMMQNL